MGRPFKDWPPQALEPWYWNGTTRAGKVRSGQWQRTRALIQIDKRVIHPARLLWQFMTKQKLDDKQRIAYHLRGVRDCQQDDVNPAHYILLVPRPLPKRKNKRRAHPIPDLISLMQLSGFYPSTVEECLARWPDLTYNKEDIDATIKEVAL